MSSRASETRANARWLKRAVAFGVIPAVVLLGLGAVVRAAVTIPNTFKQNDLLSYQKINDNFTAIANTINSGTVNAATSAATASGLSCTGCVGATQLGSGVITLGAITSRQGSGVTGASGVGGVYYYVGGTCLANEILIGGSCWATETAGMASAALLTSTVDGANKRWVCYYHTTAGTAPNAYGISNCLKATWP